MSILSLYISKNVQKVLSHWLIYEKHSKGIHLVKYSNTSLWAHTKIDLIKVDFSQNFIISYTPLTLYSKVALDRMLHYGTQQSRKNWGAK